VVSPESVRAWADTLDALGTNVTYTEYPGVGHTSWENAYQDGQIFEWFDQFERDAYPDRVRFATSRYKYDTAHWVRIDALTPGTLAQVDAQFSAPNRVAVTTSDLEGFTLHVADHPQVEAGEMITVHIDGEALQVSVADTLSFSRQAGAWTAEAYGPDAHAKRPGAEGPMRAVLSDRHIYVYGTADDPSEDELQRRRDRAVTAATWSVYRGPFWGRVKVFPRIVADRDVRESDLETSNLVLFGTRSTNRLIERYSDQLPMHLDPSSEAYGLAYVFPMNGQYVLVSSGLPWWTDASGDGGGPPFANQVPALELTAWPDFRLFTTTADSILVEGRFDAAWRLSEDDVQALRGTGAVGVSETALPPR